ncbi:MAG: 2-C-methyl-D-erythritol 4-phosphate cytidylyltransferase [Candidatus Omnitrophica bacterium]|nr:2-C-methyl-D-erythritol 4-phosphate cytidylyltransferase [Candidatus Omnitrophota bacterium]
MPGAVCAIVVAGGAGKRLKARVRKAFVPLKGRPMLAWTLAAFERSPAVDAVVVVAHPGDLEKARRMVRRFRFRKVTEIVPGGGSRMASVRHGLAALPAGARWVAVHDAARPLVTPELIRQTVAAARSAKAAIAAVPVVPTVKEAAGGWVHRTLDRSRLWAVQTPQVFERKLLEAAHRRANGGAPATDDAALVEKLGRRIRIVMGSHRNIKVTTPEDRVIAEALIQNRYRVQGTRYRT